MCFLPLNIVSSYNFLSSWVCKKIFMAYDWLISYQFSLIAFLSQHPLMAIQINISLHISLAHHIHMLPNNKCCISTKFATTYINCNYLIPIFIRSPAMASFSPNWFITWCNDMYVIYNMYFQPQTTKTKTFHYIISISSDYILTPFSH